MNNTSKVLLAIGTGLGAFALGRYVYKTLYMASKWDFKVISVRHTSIFPRLEGLLEFSFKNVSNVRIELRNLNLEVYASNVKIGSIEKPETFTLAPLAETELGIKLAVEYKSLTKALGNTYTSVKTFSDFPIDVVGTIEMKGLLGWITIPIEYLTTGQEIYGQLK